MNLFYNTAVTRSLLEILSKDEFIVRLLQVENIEDKLEHLNKRFDDFLGKYNERQSELQVSNNCSNLLRNRVTEMEKNALSTAQYVIEISPVPKSISDQNLEEQVCKAFIYLFIYLFIYFNLFYVDNCYFTIT